jgi:hypothetical protein
MNKNPPSDVLLRHLVPLSLLYLALPYLIFFAGWLKGYLALPGMGLVVLPLLCHWREAKQIAASFKPPSLKRRHVALLLLLSLVFLGISGIGGYGHQDTDWPKHNAVFKDLIEKPWPVVYEMRDASVPLVYYVAFYLPAALLGKLGGWSLANQALFAWAGLGLLLALLWFVVLVRRAAWGVLLLFPLFSGLDIIGQLAIAPLIYPLRPPLEVDWTHIEWWSIGWQYSSNATLLFWVPNQALAGWIAGGISMYAMRYALQKRYTLFYLGLTLLWSPFVTLGLLPYLLADLITEKGALSGRLKPYISPPNLCGLGLFVVVSLFYSAKLGQMPPSLSGDVPHGFILSFAENARENVLIPILIVVFCLLEFGAYGIIIWGSKPDWDRKTKGLFAATMLCLALLPLYRFGAMGDFTMRTSIPALFFLAVFLAQALYSPTTPKLKRAVLIALIVIGAVTPSIEYRRHVTHIYQAGRIVQRPPASEVWDLQRLQNPGFDSFAFQYLGSPQTPFFEFMAKQPDSE